MRVLNVQWQSLCCPEIRQSWNTMYSWILYWFDFTQHYQYVFLFNNPKLHRLGVSPSGSRVLPLGGAQTELPLQGDTPSRRLTSVYTQMYMRIAPSFPEL